MLADSTFDQLTVLTGDGTDSIDLARVTVRGNLTVSTSGGDDFVRCVDCVFDGQTVFDGGNGQDTLELINSKFARRPRLLGWEVMKL
jgi:hypothetical protein